MATRDITFRILGTLDPTLLAALRNAQQGIRGLSNAQRTFNGRAMAQARQLAAAQGVLKNVEQYKAMAQAIRQSQQLRGQELLTANRLLAQRNEETRKLEGMKQSYERLREVYRENKRSMSAEAAQVMKSQIQAARLDLKSQEAAVKNIDKAYAAASRNVAKLNAELQRQQQQLAQLGSRVNVGNLAAQEAALRAQIQSTTAALNAEIAALERRNQIHANFANAQQNLTNAYSNFQNAVDTAGTLMSPFTAATKNAMDFEYAMSKVKALTQMRNIRSENFEEVRKSMAALETQAKQLGATTEFTQTEIANAMAFYGMAGWDTSRIQAIMQSTIDLASIAGDHNIARTADVLSDDLSAIGLKAGRSMRLTSGKIVEESQYFTDAFAYAITQANLNRESLHEALKYNAPTAHASGLSIGETFAMNMVAASSGIKGSMAGTAFRAGWTRFLAPPKTAAKALQEMGLEASDATKSILEAQAALKEIGVADNADLFTKITAAYQHYQTLDEGSKAGWLKNLVGQNALSAWQIVFDTGNIEQIAKIAQEIDSGAIEGWAADTANVMRDNTTTQFELLKSSIDACAQSLGSVFLPAARDGMKVLADGATSFNEWIKNNQTAVQWAGVLAAALSGIIVAGAGIALVGSAFSFVSNGLMVAVGAARAVVTALSVARTAVMGFGVVTAAAGAIASAPLWAIAAAIAGVIAVIGYATGAFDGLGDAIANAWNHPQGAITGFCELVKSSIDGAVNYVVNRWNTLRSALSHPIDAVLNFLDHGDVIGGNVKSGEQQAQERAINSAHAVASGGNFGGGGANFDGSVDTTVLQTAINETANAVNQIPPPAWNISNSLNMATPATQAFTAAAQGAQFGMMNFGMSTQAAQFGVTSLGTSSQAAQFSVDALNNSSMVAQFGITSLGTSSQAAQFSVDALNNSSMVAQFGIDSMNNSALASQAGIDAMSFAAAGSTGNVNAMSSGAAAASGALSGLGAAVSSAIGALMSAGASAASSVMNFVSSLGSSPSVGHNALGGIYPRGEFLTTFAERSPEAAIPIDNSARARNLWLTTGSLLGFDNILPTDNPIPRRLPFPFPRRPDKNPSTIPFPRIPFPYQTPPTFPALEPSLGNGSPVINISINVNISGNADRQEVQHGIEDALPRVKSFAEQLAEYNHERARRSYA